MQIFTCSGTGDCKTTHANTGKYDMLDFNVRCFIIARILVVETFQGIAIRVFRSTLLINDQILISCYSFPRSIPDSLQTPLTTF
jgi:hypothetical protein